MPTKLPNKGEQQADAKERVVENGGDAAWMNQAGQGGKPCGDIKEEESCQVTAPHDDENADHTRMLCVWDEWLCEATTCDNFHDREVCNLQAGYDADTGDFQFCQFNTTWRGCVPYTPCTASDDSNCGVVKDRGGNTMPCSDFTNADRCAAPHGSGGPHCQWDYVAKNCVQDLCVDQSGAEACTKSSGCVWHPQLAQCRSKTCSDLTKQTECAVGLNDLCMWNSWNSAPPKCEKDVCREQSWKEACVQSSDSSTSCVWDTSAKTCRNETCTDLMTQTECAVLLKSGSELCRWNADTKTCVPDVCGTQPDKDACDEDIGGERLCRWNYDKKACVPDVCKTQQDADACAKDVGPPTSCVWDPAKGQCRYKTCRDLTTKGACTVPLGSGFEPESCVWDSSPLGEGCRASTPGKCQEIDGAAACSGTPGCELRPTPPGTGHQCCPEDHVWRYVGHGDDAVWTCLDGCSATTAAECETPVRPDDAVDTTRSLCAWDTDDRCAFSSPACHEFLDEARCKRQHGYVYQLQVDDNSGGYSAFASCDWEDGQCVQPACSEYAASATLCTTHGCQFKTDDGGNTDCDFWPPKIKG